MLNEVEAALEALGDKLPRMVLESISGPARGPVCAAASGCMESLTVTFLRWRTQQLTCRRPSSQRVGRQLHANSRADSNGGGMVVLAGLRVDRSTLHTLASTSIPAGNVLTLGVQINCSKP
jgi:hypothetical protein